MYGMNVYNLIGMQHSWQIGAELSHLLESGESMWRHCHILLSIPVNIIGDDRQTQLHHILRHLKRNSNTCTICASLHIPQRLPIMFRKARPQQLSKSGGVKGRRWNGKGGCGKRGEQFTHYEAESLSWYSLALLKQPWTPVSAHNRFITPANSGLSSPSSAWPASAKSCLASSWKWMEKVI